MDEKELGKLLVVIAEAFLNQSEQMFKMQVSLASLQAFVALKVNEANAVQVLKEIQELEQKAIALVPNTSLEALRATLAEYKSRGQA